MGKSCGLKTVLTREWGEEEHSRSSQEIPVRIPVKQHSAPYSELELKIETLPLQKIKLEKTEGDKE